MLLMHVSPPYRQWDRRGGIQVTRPARLRRVFLVHRPSLLQKAWQLRGRRSNFKCRVPRHIPRLHYLVCPREHPKIVNWVVDTRPEANEALAPGLRRRRVFPAAVRWANEYVRRSRCSGSILHIILRRAAGFAEATVRFRASHAHVRRFRPQGFGWR